jgi:hypothetical protein
MLTKPSTTQVKEPFYYTLLDVQNQGGFFMRAIIYGVFNKKTNKRLYIDCRERNCQRFIDSHPDRADLVIRYKWKSF